MAAVNGISDLQRRSTDIDRQLYSVPALSVEAVPGRSQARSGNDQGAAPVSPRDYAELDEDNVSHRNRFVARGKALGRRFMMGIKDFTKLFNTKRERQRQRAAENFHDEKQKTAKTKRDFDEQAERLDSMFDSISKKSGHRE
jgi:hypothetical protein